MEFSKQVLREKLLAARPHSSLGLTDQLMKLIQQKVPRTLASYSPTKSEPDVGEFNQLVSAKLNLVFPKVVSDELIFCQGPLAKGSFNILEPIGPEEKNFDLMILPALAVDGLGNRLGKGRGFYDRFLNNKALTCYAVVFDEEVLEALPTDSWDKKVSGFLTPTRLVNF